MADYSYRGRNESGQMVEGELSGLSRSAITDQLKQRKIIPIEIHEKKTSASKNIEFSLPAFKKKTVPLDDLIMFCRQMHALTRSGIPLIKAINGLADASSSLLLSDVLKTITTNLTQGTTLSVAFRNHADIFSELFISMIQMGESTGKLEKSFSQLVHHLELEKDTRKKVKSATRYPIIVISLIAVAMLVVNLFIIPSFSNLFESLNADLPVPTLILVTTSNFFINYWWLLLMATIVGNFFFISWKKSEEGSLVFDRLILKVPIVGPILERIALGRFARPFAMMLNSGIPLLQALSVSSRTVGNKHISKGIENMLHGIERGESLLSTASSSKMFNSLILQMISVGEQAGNLPEMLEDIAEFYDQEIEYDLKRLAEALEPILLVIMGVGISV